MKKGNTILKFISKIALKSALKQEDSACMMFGYEPKKPICLKKNKKL